MAVLRVFCAAVLLLAASGYVPAAAGGGGDELLAWRNGGGVGQDSSKPHDWICHYNDHLKDDGRG